MKARYLYLLSPNKIILVGVKDLPEFELEKLSLGTQLSTLKLHSQKQVILNKTMRGLTLLHEIGTSEHKLISTFY